MGLIESRSYHLTEIVVKKDFLLISYIDPRPHPPHPRPHPPVPSPLPLPPDPRAFRKLEQMGMHVRGDYNSPVIPTLIYVPAKMSAFSKECYDRGLAVRLATGRAERRRKGVG